MIARHYKVLKELAKSPAEIFGLGIAAAGMVASDSNTVRFGPNVAWNEYQLGSKVAALIDDDIRVVVENDANAAAWAEFKLGSFRDASPFLAITLGTGLGGAIIIDGKLVRGFNGMAAEFAHFRFQPDGALCGCGLKGCYEQYGSGSALNRYVKECAEADPDGARQIIERAGSIAEIIGPQVTELANQGDSFSVSVLTQLGHWIGEGMATLANIFDPEVFVIGGGLVTAESFLMKPIQTSFANHLVAAEHRTFPPIAFAQSGNDAGAIGAALLAI
jgi:glucokinase